jgi:hypothetical protein
MQILDLPLSKSVSLVSFKRHGCSDLMRPRIWILLVIGSHIQFGFDMICLSSTAKMNLNCLLLTKSILLVSFKSHGWSELMRSIIWISLVTRFKMHFSCDMIHLSHFNKNPAQLLITNKIYVIIIISQTQLE